MFSGKHGILFTGYSGWMVRMAVWRDWDAICEEGNEGVLRSEVMEEEVNFLPEYFPLLKGTSRNGKSENANVLWRVMEVVSTNE